MSYYERRERLRQSSGSGWFNPSGASKYSGRSGQAELSKHSTQRTPSPMSLGFGEALCYRCGCQFQLGSIEDNCTRCTHPICKDCRICIAEVAASQLDTFQPTWEKSEDLAAKRIYPYCTNETCVNRANEMPQSTPKCKCIQVLDKTPSRNFRHEQCTYCLHCFREMINTMASGENMGLRTVPGGEAKDYICEGYQHIKTPGRRYKCTMCNRQCNRYRLNNASDGLYTSAQDSSQTRYYFKRKTMIDAVDQRIQAHPRQHCLEG